MTVKSVVAPTRPLVAKSLPMDLSRAFEAPSAEHAACPFWFWNGELEAAELLRQVREMHEKGVRGFIIHSRAGRNVPYLSETWFDRCRVVIEEAARLGMKAWLYDEDNWPSGYASGRVLESHPDFTAKHLAVERHYIDGTGPVTLTVTEADEVVAVLAGPILRVQAIPLHPLMPCPSGGASPGAWTDRNCFSHHYPDAAFTPLVVEDDRVHWDAPTDQSCIVIFRQRRTDFRPAYSGSSYVDLLNPRATRAFLALTHEQYFKHFAEHFGQTILGFFTDESGFYNNFLNHNPGTVPWTDALLSEFQQRRGYDLKPWLIALWEETGDASGRVRADYWRTVAELFEANFTGLMAEWCESHRVALTGHLLIEESLLAMQRFCANPFNVLRPLHVTGVDRIDEQYDKISEKLAASIGHAHGRKRILSETFALIGWKLAPPYMKRIVDYQFVRGVNWLVPHAFYYSIDDWRKLECPPSVFFQNPWWDHSRPLWDHVARLSAVLSQGRHVAPVALYYPIEQAWDSVLPESPGPTQGVYPPPYVPFRQPIAPHAIEVTDAAMNRIAGALMGGQYDFDFVDHGLVIGATVGEMLRIGPESFRALVVPPLKAIHGGALRQMLRFAKAGGLVVFSGELPSRLLDREPIEEWKQLSDALARAAGQTIAFGEGAIAFVPVGETGILQILSRRVRPDLRIVDSAAMRKRVLCETQHAQFRHTRLPKVCQSFTYHRRHCPDADVYFIVNESEQSFEATIDMIGGPHVQRWLTDSGVRETLESHVLAAGVTRVALAFAPWQSHLLVLQSGKPEAVAERAPLWTQPLDGWTLDIGGVTSEGELVSWNELGRPAFSGIGTYRRSFECEPIEKGTQLQLDLGTVLETAKVRVNGVEFPPLAFPPYVVDITRAVVDGPNQLVIEVANTLVNELDHVERPSGLLGPVRLIARAASAARASGLGRKP